MSLLLNEFKSIEALKAIRDLIRTALAKSSDFIFYFRKAQNLP